MIRNRYQEKGTGSWLTGLVGKAFCFLDLTEAYHENLT